MVGAVAEVVEPTFSVGENTARGGADAVAIGAFDDAWGGGECSTTNRVVLGASPEAENDEIGMMILPPERVSNVLLRNPEDRIILNV